MLEFVLFCGPAIVYLVVQSRRRDVTVALARRRLGVTWGSPAAYGWAALSLMPLLLLGWAAIATIPDDVFAAPEVSIAQLTSVGAVLGVVLRAVGEEVLFRGLIGGVLMRRLGFLWGNLLQTSVFVVPHLLVMLVDVRAWPIVAVQFLAGWVLGRLRHRSDSVAPGAVVHAVINVAAGVSLG